MIDNKYFVVSKIGMGGFSDVYLVTDQTDRKYAVKIIRNSPAVFEAPSIGTLQREALIMEKLALHPNILKCIDFVFDGTLESEDRTSEASYNLLEYASNGSFAELISKTGPLDESVGRFYAYQIAHALKYMHDSQIAHMDIKPSNILLDSNFNVKIADFGIVELDISGSGLTNSRKGTKHFVAPEITRLGKDERYNMFKADVYSFGATVFYLARGGVPNCLHEHGEPFSTFEPGRLNEHMTDDEGSRSPSGEKLTADQNGLINLLKQCLHTDPRSRPTMEEVLNHSWFDSLDLDISPEKVYVELSRRMEFISSKRTSRSPFFE